MHHEQHQLQQQLQQQHQQSVVVTYDPQQSWKWSNGVLPTAQQQQQPQQNTNEQFRTVQPNLMNNHFNAYPNPLEQTSFHVSKLVQLALRLHQV